MLKCKKNNEKNRGKDRRVFLLEASQGAEMGSVLSTRLGDHARKGGIWVTEQVAWGIVFCDLALVHDQDAKISCSGQIKKKGL
jgi:hypothetical protein